MSITDYLSSDPCPFCNGSAHALSHHACLRLATKIMQSHRLTAKALAHAITATGAKCTPQYLNDVLHQRRRWTPALITALITIDCPPNHDHSNLDPQI